MAARLEERVAAVPPDRRRREPVWSRDGSSVTYSYPRRRSGIYDQSVEGDGAPRRLVTVPNFHWLVGWTPRNTWRARIPERAACPGPGVAGLSFNCARGGTTCNWSVGRFMVHELQSDAAGTVTRLHMTFEQTCAQIDTLNTAGFGTATGELWIVNGTTPF